MVVPFPIDPLGGEVGRAERERRAASWANDTETWVDPNGRRLSSRVWLAGQSVRQAIADELTRAIATGEDPLIVADRIERALLPELRPSRDAAGAPVPGQARRIVTSSPNPKGFRSGAGDRPFAGSYAARRLARTEISRAHGRATIEAAKRNPFTEGVRWVLSAGHKGADACDRIAHAGSRGMPDGVYRPDEVPTYPHHPHERCVLSPWVAPDLDEAAVVLGLRRVYGLEPTPIGGADVEPRFAGPGRGPLSELWRAWRALGGRAA